MCLVIYKAEDDTISYAATKHQSLRCVVFAKSIEMNEQNKAFANRSLGWTSVVCLRGGEIHF